MGQRRKKTEPNVDQTESWAQEKLAQKNQELQQKVQELERVNELMLDREIRMTELKAEMAALNRRKSAKDAGTTEVIAATSLKVDEKNLVSERSHVALLNVLEDLRDERKHLEKKKDELKNKKKELTILNQRLVDEMDERQQLQSELRLAHKLESLGQLAAGIAHEINTPTQFVGDNTHFLRRAWTDLEPIFDLLSRLTGTLGTQTPGLALDEQLTRSVEAADLTYLRDEVPRAIEQSLDGLQRVSAIVRAMKAFSHPDNQDKTEVDLNEAIETTVTMARNEWKYVADVETVLDPNLPLVPCLPGEINQVLLNLLINASQAIALAPDTSETKGTITLGTHQVDDCVEVRIHDTGPGVPDDIRSRIFEPFFTTKEAGHGTGQGLALVHSIVVDQHGGQLWCESSPNEGATFVFRLPLTGSPAGAEVAA